MKVVAEWDEAGGFNYLALQTYTYTTLSSFYDLTQAVTTLVPFTVVWTDGQEQTDIKKGETSLCDQANSFVLDKSKAWHW